MEGCRVNEIAFFYLRCRKHFLKGLGLSKSTGRVTRICFVEVSPDWVLLDTRKSIFNVLLPEEEDPLLLEKISSSPRRRRSSTTTACGAA